MSFMSIERSLITNFPKLVSFPNVVFTLVTIIGVLLIALELIFKGACIYLGLWIMSKILA